MDLIAFKQAADENPAEGYYIVKRPVHDAICDRYCDIVHSYYDLIEEAFLFKSMIRHMSYTRIDKVFGYDISTVICSYLPDSDTRRITGNSLELFEDHSIVLSDYITGMVTGKFKDMVTATRSERNFIKKVYDLNEEGEEVGYSMGCMY